MFLTSFSFCIFFLIVWLLYWTTDFPQKYFLILIANYIFYAFSGIIPLVLLLCMTLLTYVFSWFFSTFNITSDSLNRFHKVLFMLIIIIELSPLIFYKYLSFFLQTFCNLLSFSYQHSNSNFILPVGLSFYTFSCIAYISDIYNKKTQHINNYFLFAAALSFFPIITAGPISRIQSIIPQIREKNDFDYDISMEGARQIIWGLFKKLVIADTFAYYVNFIYANILAYSGFSLLAASLLFTFEIYCDFSGYSDIAVGLGKLFNIKVIDNFSLPYFSSSFQGFWRKWHISLSTWFRDYVYIPLGGNRCPKICKYRNILITFILSGLWHGANWTFILWGFCHGLLLVIEDLFPHKRNSNTCNSFNGI